MARVGWQDGRFADVRRFIGELYGSDLHGERVDSLAGAMLGHDDGGLGLVKRWLRSGA